MRRWRNSFEERDGLRLPGLRSISLAAKDLRLNSAPRPKFSGLDFSGIGKYTL